MVALQLLDRAHVGVENTEVLQANKDSAEPGRPQVQPPDSGGALKHDSKVLFAVHIYSLTNEQ